MFDEEAKAVQETAKTADHALSSLDGLGRFVQEAFGYPIREAGGFLGDWIKFQRDNWSATCGRAKAKLDERGVKKIEPIPAKYGVAIIEGASLEDDGLLQGMWAGLMANALDPEAPYSPSKLIISLLKELEPYDALILKRLASSQDEGAYPHALGYDFERLKEELKLDDRLLRLALLNLQRTALIKDATISGSSERNSLNSTMYRITHHEEVDVGAMIFGGISIYELTDLGSELMKACAVIQE